MTPFCLSCLNRYVLWVCDMLFRSAVDRWFYGLAISLPVAICCIAIPALPGASSTADILTISALVAVSLIPTWLLISTYYRVDSAILRIQAGPFSWSVPLEQIRSVTASRTWLSSPALSTSRLRIDYGKRRSILVSPKRRNAFIEAIGYPGTSILSSSLPR